MLRKLIAFLFNITASALAGVIVSILIMGNSVKTEILYIAIASLVAGSILTIVFEQEKVSIINWWWHRLWLLIELKKVYSLFLEKKLGKDQAHRLISTDLSHIRLQVGTEQEDIIPFIKRRFSNKSKERALIVGEAGSGKSTAILHAMHVLANLSFRSLGFMAPIPLLVKCENYSGKLLNLLQEDLAKLTVGKSGQVIGENIDWLLRKGKILIVLDALDQVPENHRNEFVIDIENFVTLPAYRDSAFLMTCRDTHVEFFTAIHNLSVETFQIKELDDEGVHALVEIYKRSDDDSKEIIQKLDERQLLAENGLARIPYWLPLIVNDDQFETNSAKILNDSLNRLLKTEYQNPGAKIRWQRQLPIVTQVNQTRITLSLLAYEFMRIGNYRFDYVTARKFIIETLANQGFVELSADNVIGLSQDSHILDDSQSVIVAGRPASISFRHSLLLEYLAASAILLYPQFLTPEKVHEYISAPAKWWSVLYVLNQIMRSGIQGELQEKREELNRYIQESSDVLNSRLVTFFLLHWTDRILKLDEYKAVQDKITELLLSDVYESHLASYSQLAHLLPKDFVDLLSEICETQSDLIGLKKVARHLIGQEVSKGHVSNLLILISKNKQLTQIACDFFVDRSVDCVPVLIELMKTDADDVAFESLAILKDKRAVQPLCALLGTKPIINIGLEKEAVDTFFYMVLHNRNQAIIETLGEIGDPDAIPFIVKATEQDYSVYGFMVDQEALDAIAKMGIAGVRTLLDILTKTDIFSMRLSIIPKLIMSTGDAAIPILLDGLDHRKPSVRFACVKALGLLKSTEAVEPLTLRIDDVNFTVRNEAISSLGEIGITAAPVLIKALDRDTGFGKPKTRNYSLYIKRDHASFTNRGIVNALSSIGQEVVIQLLDATHHSNLAVQIAVVEALGNIGDERALIRLAEILGTTENILIRFETISALGGIGTRAALELLKKYGDGHNGDKWIFIAILSAFARKGNTVGIDHLIKVVESGQVLAEPADSLLRMQAVKGLYIANVQTSIPAMRSFISYLQTQKIKGYKGNIKTIQSIIDGFEAKDSLSKLKHDEEVDND